MKKNELIEAMQAVVNRKVKAYREDFELDKVWVLTHDSRFYWFVRPHGTILMPLTYESEEDVQKADRFAHAIRNQFANPDGTFPKEYGMYRGVPKTGELVKLKHARDVVFYSKI